MLVLAIILLVLGAVVVYLGRPREQFIVGAGVLIFAVGVVLLIIWAVNRSGANTAGVMLAMAIPPGGERMVHTSHGEANIDPAIPVAPKTAHEPVIVAFLLGAIPIVAAFVLQVVDAAGESVPLWIRTALTGIGALTTALAALWARSQVTPTAAPKLDGHTMLVPMVEREEV